MRYYDVFLVALILVVVFFIDREFDRKLDAPPEGCYLKSVSAYFLQSDNPLREGRVVIMDCPKEFYLQETNK